MSLLGLDIGTTGCKASVVDYDGNVLQSAYTEYSLSTPAPGLYELDPNAVWDAVTNVIGCTAGRLRHDPVKAVGISSFGEAVTPINSDGIVLRNAILYTDPRGTQEVLELEQNLGAQVIQTISGAAPHPMYAIAKIMWIQRHLPDVYRNTWKFLFFADFILYKLGARPHTDY